LPAQGVPAMREPHHHLAYQDSVLRVLRVEVPAHDTTLMHRHDPDYFWIGLGATTVVNARLGSPDATINSANLALHYTVGAFSHVARNPGAAPFRNITVELLKPQTNPRNLCESAVADQVHTCPQSTAERTRRFPGASEWPGFETDGLRVSLVNIQPGTTMHGSREVARPWIIALDTNDARTALHIERSDGVAGKGGEWTAGIFRPTAGVPWVIRNSGSAAVRVLTVVERTAGR